MVSLSRVLNWVLGSVVVVSAAFLSWSYWGMRSEPPVKYLSIAVLTRDVQPGGTLIVRTTSDRIISCAGHTDRYIIKLNSIDNVKPDEEAVYSDTVKTTPEVGQGVNIIFRLKLPDDIEPGTYIYRAFTHFDCDGHRWHIPVPEASFRVAPKP